MKMIVVTTVAVLALALAAGTLAQPDESPPPWAYPVNPPDFKLPPDEGAPRTVPGSMATFTLTQIRNLFFAPDWHPADHPLMPEIVAQGRKPGVMACGSCHRADGPGGPENAGLAGLPAAYIVQQMADFKSGTRQSALPQRLPVKLMVDLAKASTVADAEAAAAYFSSLKPRGIIKVLESESAPKTFVAGWFLAAAESGEREPLGARIIEVPEHLQHFVSRDARTRFIAYVPVGSVEKGRMLATAGGGKSVACAGCHGTDLRGVGGVPGIAGRSPSYFVRQLYDYKRGVRAGNGSNVMKPVVERLTIDDMVLLAAYSASLTP